MKFISLNKDNIDQEHICCALSNNKNKAGVEGKKEWLKGRFKEGLKFIKLDARAKVFIEYLPAEYSWRPVSAPGYLMIHCLWVSGKYQKQGYAKELMHRCLKDAKGTNGVVAVASKQTWLTDPNFYIKNGFEKCDEAPPAFELMVHRLNDKAPMPVFFNPAKRLKTKEKGLVIYYSNQCPFTEFYTDEMLKVAQAKKLAAKKIKIKSAKQAQKVPSAFGVFSVFLNGDFLTYKIMSSGQFEQFLDKELSK